MKFICHRGNLNGPNIRENNVDYILNTLNNYLYDVEIDVWLLNNNILISHDLENKEMLTFKQFEEALKRYTDRLWVHCKNIQALSFFSNTNYNCFGHNNDDFVLTSHLHVFTKPGVFYENSILVMPELTEISINNSNLINYTGVLTDYPIKYETYYNSCRSQ